MTTVFRLLLFVLSNLGMWELLRRKTKIDSCFFPSLTIALQVAFLFVAGILNLLKEAAAVLWRNGSFRQYTVWSRILWGNTGGILRRA